MLNAITQGKIRNTLLVGLVLMTIMPTFIAVTIYYYQAKANIETQVYNTLETVMDKQVQFINNWFWQQRQYALLLSTANQITSMDANKISEYLQQITYTNPAVEDLGVADRAGNVISGTKYYNGLTVRDREYFKQSLKGRTAMSQVITNRFTGNPVIVFSAPIYKDHVITGVFFSAVSLDSISRLMQNLNLDAWSESYLVSSNGRMITESAFTDQLASRGLIVNNSSLGLKVNSFGVSEALAGRRGAAKYTDYLGKEVYGVYQPINSNSMAIIIEKDVKAVLNQEVKQAFFTAFNTGTIITIMFLPAVVLLSRRFAEPLEKLAATASHIGNGQYGCSVNVKSHKEINQLASAFNKMSSQIQQMHQQLNHQIQQLEEQREEIQCQNEELAASQDELIEVNAKLEQIAITDPLTNIYNRRYLFSVLQRLLEKASTNFTPVSIVIFDIDHFKAVNDTFGHQVGDQILVQLTELISQTINNEDLIGRFGGEEFVLLLPGIDITDAEKYTEKIRKIVEGHIFNTNAGDIKITISFGVTSFTKEYYYAYGTDINRLLNVADNCLYMAKRAGRNMVVAQLPTTEMR